MPEVVIKKDGRKEVFIKEKIVVSAVKAGAPLDIAREIADDIEEEKKREMETAEIRKKVLLELRHRAPEAYRRWISYDESVKRLSRHGGMR